MTFRNNYATCEGKLCPKCPIAVLNYHNLLIWRGWGNEKKKRKEGNEKQIRKHGGHRATSCSLKIHDTERKPGRALLSRPAIHHRVRLALQGGKVGGKKKEKKTNNAGERRWEASAARTIGGGGGGGRVNSTRLEGSNYAK